MDKNATLHRLLQDSPSGDGKYKESYESAGTAIRCAIQPAGATDTALTEGQYGRAFKMFCERGVSVKVGDKIKYGGREYYVRGVEDFDYGRAVKHKEAVLHLPIVQQLTLDILTLEDGDGAYLTEAGDRLALE